MTRKKKLLAAACVLLCASVCAQSVTFKVAWKKEAEKLVRYSIGGSTKIITDERSPYAITADVGSTLTLSASAREWWTHSLRQEGVGLGKKLGGRGFTVTADLDGETFYIDADLDTIGSLQLGKGQYGFPMGESTADVKAWADEKGHSLADLQDSVKQDNVKGTERTYNSYLLDKPIMTADPTFTISDMAILGDWMKVEVFARTNEALADDSDNAVNLYDVNGALYLQTSETLDGLATAEKRLLARENLSGLPDGETAMTYVGGDGTYVVDDGKAYVTLKRANIGKFVTVRLGSKPGVE